MSIKRQYPEAPLIGVGVIVVNSAGQVLLVQRGRPPRKGQWSLPGGMLEVGEKLADAARREVREECGIEIELGDVVLIYEPIFRDSEGRIEYHYVLIDYWARHLSGVATAHDDAAAVAWATLADLPRYQLAPETQAVIEKSYEEWQKSQESEVRSQKSEVALGGK